MLHLVVACDYVELQRSENHHQADSHGQDDSKWPRYDQMVAIREEVVTVPQLSGTVLCRNMTMHYSPTKIIVLEHMCSFQHQVYVPADLCAKKPR
jgi:hypothetical protein